MTQKELAERLDIGRNTLSKIERGRYNSNISVTMLAKIAEGLEIELYKLFVFEEVEKLQSR